MSWLHTSTQDHNGSAYLDEIRRLQVELDRANEDIDAKLDRLNSVGFDAVAVRQQLVDERQRCTALEDDLARQARRDERRLHRLEKARCTQCRAKIDLSGLNRAAEGDERYGSGQGQLPRR
jgi:uncharacterized protein (UPF0335 family)